MNDQQKFVTAELVRKLNDVENWIEGAKSSAEHGKWSSAARHVSNAKAKLADISRMLDTLADKETPSGPSK